MRLSKMGVGMKAWEVFLNDEMIDKVFFIANMEENEVRDSLINHDGYSNNIEIYEEAAISKAEGR